MPKLDSQTIQPKPKLRDYQTVFITGVQGLIGWNIYQSLKSNHHVVVFSKTARPPLIGEWYEGLLEDYRVVSDIIHKEKPDIVIHAQAMCNLDLCELKPQKTHLINVEATWKLVEALNPLQTKLVYISSDHVFSGAKGGYVETDKPDPISVYGRTRVEAENHILKKYKNSLIVRPGLVLGSSMQGDIGPQDWLMSRLKKEQVASFFVDEFRSPVWMEDFIQGLICLINSNCQGVWHLGGEEEYSRYDLALKLSRIWDMQGNIRPKKREEDKDVPRIARCTLDSTKAYQIGWNPRQI